MISWPRYLTNMSSHYHNFNAFTIEKPPAIRTTGGQSSTSQHRPPLLGMFLQLLFNVLKH